MTPRMKPTLRYSITLGLSILLGMVAPRVGLAQGTPTPTPYQTVLDSNGRPISGAKVCTYIAGTTTPVATYTSSALSVANSNPIVTDTAGRYTAWLQPGASYKFIVQNNDGTANTCNGTVIKTVDGIPAVPGSAANLDITGTAGETLTAGQIVYLSDGSGAKTAGQWFKADSANTYSSTVPELGTVPNNITSGQAGTIRLSGSATGLSSLTIGTTYYVGTAGAVTSTILTNSRFIGVADTTTSLVFTPNPSVGIVTVANQVVQGRLTLTTATPVTTADVTGASAVTLRFAPYGGNLIALYTGSAWVLYTFPELSIAVPATTVTMYDVFVYDNAGTRTLELLAWTNDTTRATALVTQDGVLVKTGALTRRYVGSFRTASVSGQTEDSFTKRFVWNYYNRVPRTLKRFEATDTWGPYNTAAYRQANASTSNQVECVIGVAEVEMLLGLTAMSRNDTAADNTFISISDQATTVSTTPDANVTGQPLLSNASATQITPGRAELRKYPAIGHHVFGWLEQGSGANNTTWYGDNGAATKYQSGLLGSIPG